MWSLFREWLLTAANIPQSGILPTLYPYRPVTYTSVTTWNLFKKQEQVNGFPAAGVAPVTIRPPQGCLFWSSCHVACRCVQRPHCCTGGLVVSPGLVQRVPSVHGPGNTMVYQQVRRHRAWEHRRADSQQETPPSHTRLRGAGGTVCSNGRERGHCCAARVFSVFIAVGMCITITEDDAIHISMHCQRSGTLQIHESNS